MNILLLNFEYPPLGGGAASATYYMLREMSKSGAVSGAVEIDLITSSVSRFRVEQPSSSLRLHFLDIGKAGSLHYQSLTDLLGFAWKSYFYARKLCARRRFQLIHAFFGIPSGFTAVQLDLPYIVSLRGSDVPFYNQRFALLDHLLFKGLSKRIWQRAEAVVANSRGLKELALQTSPGQRIEIIPNGVDTELFSPPIRRNRTDGPLRLISTGRLIERKGYQYLLSALRGNSDYELVLIGDGDRRLSLEQTARALDVQVQFTGRLERNEIISRLREADLFVLPSLNEGMSNSILEALACGLPIITTHVGGSDELVEDGVNGFVVEKANVAALKQALSRYVARPDLLEEHGRASREKALSMSWAQVSRDYLRLYERVAQKGG